jgi:5'-3' exonuclease
MDKELVGQIDIVHKVVTEMGLIYFEMDGYEADDLIGTIVEKVKSQKSKVKSMNFVKKNIRPTKSKQYCRSSLSA